MEFFLSTSFSNSILSTYLAFIPSNHHPFQTKYQYALF